MKFKYTLVEDKYLPGKSAYLPLIDINLGSLKIPVKCLIDSGSPITIIHSPLAVMTGIKPIEGRKGSISGVGGKPINGYYHPIEFNIYGYPCRCEAFLSAELLTPYCLLGQIGFFQNFKVIFNLKKLEFEAIPISL